MGTARRKRFRMSARSTRTAAPTKNVGPEKLMAKKAVPHKSPTKKPPTTKSLTPPTRKPPKSPTKKPPTKKPTRKTASRNPMRHLLDALQTSSYRQWATAITELREHVDSGAQVKITELDLLMILRPYLWWRHNPGFADVIATCETAMPVILAHIDEFGAKGKQAGSFLATYLDTGKHDGHCNEIEIYIAAEEWAAMLQGSEAKAMRALSKLMYDIYGRKHIAYWVLSRVGWQQVATLGSLIHGLPPADQTFILHALDASLHQPGVRKFYKDFIAGTPYPHLVAEARRYAGLESAG